MPIHRWLLLLGVVLTVTPILGGSPGSEHPYAPYEQRLPLREGVGLYDGERLITTVPAATLLDAVKTKGDWVWVGRGWVRQSECVPIQEAVEFFSRRVDRQPTPFDLVSRARALFQVNEFALATRDCDQALELDPKNVEGHVMRGRCAAEVGELDTALMDFNAALALNKASAAAWLYRGCTYLKRAQYEPALRDFDRSIGLDPKSTTALAARGQTHAKLGQLRSAVADFTAALAINPSYVPAYNGRGNIAFREGDFQQAIDDYSQAIELDPTHAEVYLNRAAAYERRGEIATAIGDSNQAIRLKPTPAAFQLRAGLFRAAGKNDDADRDRETAKSLTETRNQST